MAFSGEKLRQIRLQRGLSQRDMPVAHDTVSAVESGRRNPHPSTLRKLAEALGVEVRDFFEEAEEAPKVEAPLLPETQDKERRGELQGIRELLTDAHAMFEELAEEYKATGTPSKLETLASIAMFSVMGAEQFMEDEVGPAEDRASMRVYTAGARLEEFVEDLLETIQSTTTGTVGAEVAYLDAHRRRRAG